MILLSNILMICSPPQFYHFDLLILILYYILKVLTFISIFLLIGSSVTAHKEHHVKNAVCEFPDGYSYRSIHIFVDAFFNILLHYCFLNLSKNDRKNDQWS